MRPSGTESGPAGWVAKASRAPSGPRPSACRMRSTSAKERRSSTARMDDVTRFSPCEYVENSGFGMTTAPAHVVNCDQHAHAGVASYHGAMELDSETIEHTGT